MVSPSAAIPLVVDIDGTLVATDTLWELVAAYLKKHPVAILQLVAWVFAGKAQFKARLVSAVTLEVDTLPYRQEFLEWLREEKRGGRRLLLASGADQRVADAIADHLGFFERVLASDGIKNATGSVKADMIEAAIGPHYEYAGNSMVDLAVWRRCGSAVVVAPYDGVLPALDRHNIHIVRLFAAPKLTWKIWSKAIRTHQWVKNVLVFLPLIAGHRVLDPAAVGASILAFLAFGFTASAGYLVNDLFDLTLDRRHSTKRRRPLSAGLISIPQSIAAIFILVTAAVAISAFLPWNASLLLLGYLLATLTYSFFLKKMLLADVVFLALFYTVRVLYGGSATGIEISLWLLAFSVFSFFSLGAVKRINDLAKMESTGSEKLERRAYRSEDRQALVPQAAATANIAVLVLILYLNSTQVTTLYRHPRVLWVTIPPLLYWFNRIIALGNRGTLPDDPILFGAKDAATYAVVAVLGLTVLAAIL